MMQNSQSVILQCSECGNRLRIEPTLGAEVECKVCRNRLLVSAKGEGVELLVVKPSGEELVRQGVEKTVWGVIRSSDGGKAAVSGWRFEESRVLPKVALVVAGVLFMGVALALVWFPVDGGNGSERGGNGKDGHVDVGGEEPVAGRVGEQMLSDAEGVLGNVVAVVAGFLEAGSVEERLLYVRDAERIGPLMSEYYGEKGDGPVNYRKIAPRRSLAYSEVMEMVFTEVTMEDYSTRQVALLYDGEGKLKVDWEKFVAYSEMTFEEMRERRPVEPVLIRVRVGVLGDENEAGPPYWNFGFREGDGLDNYMLKERDSGAELYGYVLRGTAVATELRGVFAGGKSRLLTLRVRYPEGAEADNQVWIEELVARGWVLGGGGE